MEKDYNIKSNRQELTERIVKMNNDKIVYTFIRLITYCEMRSTQPDRQEFWAYLEEILGKNDTPQLTLFPALADTLEIIEKNQVGPLLDKGFSIK